jgi:serine/threonine protein kinase
VSRVPKPAFEPYDVLEQLSGSRTGSVFKARHQTTGRIVALKVLSRDILNSPQYVERFHRKAQILSKLNHPNIVRALDSGQRDGVPYLVMEFIDGTDLRSIIKQRTLLTVRQAVDYVIQAATGLGALHAMGICHRNIKPSNLLVDSRGTVRIVGLGMAHVENGADLDVEDIRLTIPGQVMGTYDFMAPEQAFDSGTVDLRADIYALGCTLYAMLIGKAPYPGKTPLDQVIAHREMPIPSLRAVRADVPECLDQVFQKMMAKGPDERYGNTEQLIAELRSCVDFLRRGERLAAPPSPAARPVCSPPSRVMGPSLQPPPKTETSVTVRPQPKASPLPSFVSGPSPLISPFATPPSTHASPPAVDPSFPAAPPPPVPSVPPSAPTATAPSVPSASESLLARRTLPVTPPEIQEDSPLSNIEPPKEEFPSRSETPTPSGPIDAPLTSIEKPVDPGPLTWAHEAVVWILLIACVSGLTAVWLLWPTK